MEIVEIKSLREWSSGAQVVVALDGGVLLQTLACVDYDIFGSV